MAPLPEYNANIECVAPALLPGNEASYFDRSRCGHQNPGQHFDSRRFTCAVRTDVTHNFSLLDIQTNPINGADCSIFRFQERGEYAKTAWTPFEYTELLNEIL